MMSSSPEFLTVGGSIIGTIGGAAALKFFKPATRIPAGHVGVRHVNGEVYRPLGPKRLPIHEGKSRKPYGVKGPGLHLHHPGNGGFYILDATIETLQTRPFNIMCQIPVGPEEDVRYEDVQYTTIGAFALGLINHKEDEDAPLRAITTSGEKNLKGNALSLCHRALRMRIDEKPLSEIQDEPQIAKELGATLEDPLSDFGMRLYAFGYEELSPSLGDMNRRGNQLSMETQASVIGSAMALVGFDSPKLPYPHAVGSR